MGEVMGEHYDSALAAWERDGEEAYELEKLDGMYVGMLDEDEMKIFEGGIERGWAKRSYSHGFGFMGLAKVKVEFPK